MWGCCIGARSTQALAALFAYLLKGRAPTVVRIARPFTLS